MNSARRALAILVVLLSNHALGETKMTQMYYDRFNFCARPIPPECAADSKTFQSSEAESSCEKQMQRFVASAFAYRDCMYANIEDVIRQTNQIADRFKCEREKAVNCPTAPPPQ